MQPSYGGEEAVTGLSLFRKLKVPHGTYIGIRAGPRSREPEILLFRADQVSGAMADAQAVAGEPGGSGDTPGGTPASRVLFPE